LEKALKGHICKCTLDLPPRIHNLARLAGLSGLEISLESLDILTEMNSFNIEGRYPAGLIPLPSPEEAKNYFSRAEGVFQWLMRQL